MNEPQLAASSPLPLAPSWVRLLPLVLAAAAGLVGVAVLGQQPLLLVAGVLAIGGLVFLRWPDLTTPFAIGLIYSNLAVVAVRFHGAPGITSALVPAMLLWPLFFHLFLRRERIVLGPAFPFLIAFFVVQLISCCFSDFTNRAFDNMFDFLLEGALLYVLVTNTVRTRRMLHASLWALALCGLVMSGVPLLKKFSGKSTSNFGGLAQADASAAASESSEAAADQARAAGPIGEQNRYAQIMFVLVPLGLSLVRTENGRFARWLAMGLTLLALAGAGLAFSRGAALGFVLSILAAMALRLLDRRQMQLIVVGACAVLLLLPQYLARLSTLDLVLKITTAHTQQDGAFRGRLTEMGAAALVFRDHLLIGVGPGVFSEYAEEYGQVLSLRPLDGRRQAHSMPLAIAAETGLLGLLTFGAMLFVVFRALLAARRTALVRDENWGVQIATGLLLALVIYLANGLFLHLSYIRYFWLLVALADVASVLLVRGDQGCVAYPQIRSLLLRGLVRPCSAATVRPVNL